MWDTLTGKPDLEDFVEPRPFKAPDASLRAQHLIPRLQGETFIFAATLYEFQQPQCYHIASLHKTLYWTLSGS